MATKGASFHVQVTAWNTSTKAPQAGDAANVTLTLVRDGVESEPSNAPSDLSNGEIDLEITAAEADCDTLTVSGTSATSNVQIIPAKVSMQYSALSGGTTDKTYTVTDSVSGSPLQGVLVEVYTDEAMTNKIRQGTTDASGQVTFSLNAGTYYLKRTKAGYSFTNPDTEVVS
ncbi:MAG: hypothetical protein BWX88_02758 [Planctomycetes bacterium ADurb.Bin126]|nr:MAG: hypothetical protein BWX88_02758 [Planctomycetes bacterium ADurb.Bin126]HOD79957.1 prealbumin-like fold domain-containing protein [Phycisphaerae bacterium]HQL73228.1 prealbumin-like fold domain-containing protein [Phycisphaerae bacterium]